MKKMKIHKCYKMYTKCKYLQYTYRQVYTPKLSGLHRLPWNKKGGICLKKKIIATIIGVILIVAMVVTYIFLKPENTNTTTTKISVAEVTHSAFYAPLYVAIEDGYFKEEGIEIDLILTPGADKVAAAVLSNDVQIGFAGTESAIYVYEGKEEDYLVTFAGLTKRDGQFIIGKNENFDWKDLEGKEVLVGRKGGMPALNFLNALKNAGIDPNKVNLNYSIDFASLSGAYIGGTGDYVNLFEPNATLLEKEGYGNVVASIGELSGEMPYTAFYARKSYINENKDLLEKFNNALNKGLKFVKENDAKTIAEKILPQFPDTSLEDLEKIVNRYKESDSWLETTYISKEYFENLEKLMIENDLLNDYVPYEELIQNLSNE